MLCTPEQQWKMVEGHLSGKDRKNDPRSGLYLHDGELIIFTAIYKINK